MFFLPIYKSNQRIISMKATSRSVISDAFTLILGAFVILSVYYFGSAIFQAGARITTTASSGGNLCACVDAAAAQIKCADNFIEKCSRCFKDSAANSCATTQSLDLSRKVKKEIEKIQVCATIAKSATAVSTKVKIDEEQIEEILGPGFKENCITHSFSKPKIIGKIEATALLPIDRLVAKWSYIEGAGQ